MHRDRTEPCTTGPARRRAAPQARQTASAAALAVRTTITSDAALEPRVPAPAHGRQQCRAQRLEPCDGLRGEATPSRRGLVHAPLPRKPLHLLPRGLQDWQGLEEAYLSRVERVAAEPALTEGMPALQAP
eukprot:13125295-Heterocapsa_arctica.AAC.2